ncbi:MAG TPA: hypothetical protein VHA73_12910 [Acidimicrobiales bacterium]|nr:hypothetical protein [Acidimicrobiales bacterium]
MRRLTPLDELLAHQIPEPITTVGIEHPHWRESYFFEAHGPSPDSDMVAVGFGCYPQRQAMDAVVLGRIGDQPLFAHARREWGLDPQTPVAGPVRVTIEEPFERIRLQIDGANGLQADLTFRARTEPYGLRRGRLLDDNGLLIWDQSHMIQSGVWSGEYRFGGVYQTVAGWVGQRDHSWGVRDHGRAPLWMWFAIQLPDGMLGAWHWEDRNGARIFTDGCWAPADRSDPIPVIDVRHSISWLDGGGQPTTWDGQGESVTGLGGRVVFTLAGGQQIEISARGTWGARYTPFHGGGQHLMAVTADDGREGTAVFEVTGCDHHHFFPLGYQPGPLPA